MKGIITLLLCLMLIVTLAACGVKIGGQGDIDVGIVLPTKDEPGWLRD